MKYAKLINGAIFYAPRKFTINGSVIYNPTAEMLTEAGYKPVHYTDTPVEPGEGYRWVESWYETAEEIVQNWVLMEVPISEEEALVKYSNEVTKADDETLLDATETLLKIGKVVK